MFQNISKDYAEDQFEDVKLNKKDNIKNIAKGLFDKQNLVLYILTFMVSMVGFSSNNLIFSIVPFGLALLAAAFSNGQAIGIMYILSLIGTFIRFGTNNLLTYVVTSLTFFILVLLIRPKIQEGVNEKRKIGVHLFLLYFLCK